MSNSYNNTISGVATHRSKRLTCSVAVFAPLTLYTLAHIRSCLLSELRCIYILSAWHSADSSRSLQWWPNTILPMWWTKVFWKATLQFWSATFRASSAISSKWSPGCRTMRTKSFPKAPTTVSSRFWLRAWFAVTCRRSLWVLFCGTAGYPAKSFFHPHLTERLSQNMFCKKLDKINQLTNCSLSSFLQIIMHATCSILVDGGREAKLHMAQWVLEKHERVYYIGVRAYFYLPVRKTMLYAYVRTYYVLCQLRTVTCYLTGKRITKLITYKAHGGALSTWKSQRD